MCLLIEQCGRYMSAGVLVSMSFGSLVRDFISRNFFRLGCGRSFTLGQNGYGDFAESDICLMLTPAQTRAISSISSLTFFQKTFFFFLKAYETLKFRIDFGLDFGLDGVMGSGLF